MERWRRFELVSLAGSTALVNRRESWIVGRLKQAIRAAVQEESRRMAEKRSCLCILSVGFWWSECFAKTVSMERSKCLKNRLILNFI